MDQPRKNYQIVEYDPSSSAIVEYDPFAPASKKAAQLSGGNYEKKDKKERSLEMFLSKCQIANLDAQDFKGHCSNLRIVYYDKMKEIDLGGVSDGNIFYLPAYEQGGQAKVVQRAWRKLGGQGTPDTTACPGRAS